MGGSQSAPIKINASDTNLRASGGEDVSNRTEILEDTETGVVSTSSRTDIVSTSSQTIIKRHIYKEQDSHKHTKQIHQKKRQHQLQRLAPNEIKRLVQRGSGISIASSYDSCDRQPEDKVVENRDSYFTETEEEVTETENTVSVTDSNICINRCADTSNCVTSCDTSSKTKCVCSTPRITETSGVVRSSTDTKNNSVVANFSTTENSDSETTEVPVIHITTSNSVVPSSPTLVCSNNSIKPIAILITEEKQRAEQRPDQSGQTTREVPDQSPQTRSQRRSKDTKPLEKRKIELLCERTSNQQFPNQSWNKRESNIKSIDRTFKSSVAPKSPRISNSEVICPCTPSNINRCACGVSRFFNPSKSANSLNPNSNKCICSKRRSPCLCDLSPKALSKFRELQKVSTSSASVYDQKFQNNIADNTKRYSEQTKVSSSTEFIKVSTSQKSVHAVKSAEVCSQEENVKTETRNSCFYGPRSHHNCSRHSVEETKNLCEKSRLSFKSVASENQLNSQNPQEVICLCAVGQEDKCICEKTQEFKVLKSKSPCDCDIPEALIQKPNICFCGQKTEAPCICCPSRFESFNGKFKNHTTPLIKPTDSKIPEVSVTSRIQNFTERILKPQGEDYRTHRNSCASKLKRDCNCRAQGLICLCNCSTCACSSPCKSEKKDIFCACSNKIPPSKSPLNTCACEHTCCCEPLRGGSMLHRSLTKIESTTETKTESKSQGTKRNSPARIKTSSRRSSAKRTELKSKLHCASSPGNSIEPIDVISTVVTKLPNYHSPKPVLLDVEIFPTMEHPNGLKSNQHKVVVKSYAPPHDKYFENKSSGDVHPRLPRFSSDVDRRHYRKCCNEKCEDSDDWDTYFEPDQDKDSRARQMMPTRLQRSYLPARVNMSQECNCNCNCCGSMNDHRMDKRPDMNCRMQNGSQTTPSLYESRGASPVSCECCKCRSPSPHSRFRAMNISPVHMDRSTNTSQNNLYHAKHCARSESTGSCRYTCPCSKYTTPPHPPQYETAESPRYNTYGHNDYEPLNQPQNCSCDHCQRASRNSVRPQRDYGKLPYEKHKKYGELVNELQHELGSRNGMGYGRKTKDLDDNNERGSRGKCRINETNPWVNKDDFCRSECALCPNERHNGKCSGERKCCGSAEHDRHTIERGRVEKNISKFNSNQDCWTVSK